MKQLEKNLKAVAKDLKKLTQKTDKMINWLKGLDKAQAAKKAKTKAAKRPIAKKPTRVSASDTVLAIVKRSRKGVGKTALIDKTGFEGRKIGDIVYRLKKQGKIKKDRKGLYVRA